MARIAILTPMKFDAAPWWTALNEEEQKVVKSESQELAQALVNHGHSKLAIGEHLIALRGVLEPKRAFVAFLKNFHFSQRTAYRYIKGFENAKKHLPEPALKVALAHGLNMVGETEDRPLGIYTEAVAKVPAPTEIRSAEAAQKWIRQLEDVRKMNRASKTSGQSRPGVIYNPPPEDPDTLLQECYRFVSLRYKKLPNNHKTRGNWIRALVGMLLADLGTTSQTFEAQAVPPTFKRGKGRPLGSGKKPPQLAA